MADKPKSGNPPAPSFYSAAAGMKPGGAGDAAGGAGGAGAAGAGAGQQGEKVKNIQVLLEVFDKMDKLEQDDGNKKLIQEMVTKAKEYLNKLEGGAAAKKGPASSPATGEAGSSGGQGATGAGGGSPDMSAGVGAPAA
jgi:hypothetical protein